MATLSNYDVVETAVRDYMKTVPDVIEIDYENIVQILVDLTMIQSGRAARLSYSVTRAGNEYNIVAKGFSEQSSMVDTINHFCGKERPACFACIKDVTWHPKEYALAIQANSINPRTTTTSKAYGNTRLAGRPVH